MKSTPSLTEWVVLAILAEAPTHGFAVARQLEAGSDLGRVLTVHRPAVYRAIDRLVTAELAEASGIEPGSAGPHRTVHRPTRRGHGALRRWLRTPVTHVRDLRIEFLVKARLHQRRGLDPAPLMTAQRNVLDTTLAGLLHAGSDDVVDRWRHHSAQAARAFLDELSS